MGKAEGADLNRHPGALSRLTLGSVSRGVVPMSSLWSGGLNTITALRLRWLRSASDAMGASVVIHHHST